MPALCRHPALRPTGRRPSGGAREDQLHPLVVPQDSQTKHEPAGRIRTPQVEQYGASTAAMPGVKAGAWAAAGAGAPPDGPARPCR